MRQLWLTFLLCAAVAASIDPDLHEVTVENKNAEVLINEFTFNWTLKLQDVDDNARQMMTTLTKKESYSIQRENTGFNAGLTKESVHKLLLVIPISQEFRRKIQQSLNDETCGLLVDDEVKFDQNDQTLSYIRLGYIKMRPGVDKYFLIRSLLVIKYPHLPADTRRFLECAAKYDVDEKKCPVSKNLSEMDWIAYKIWQRAKAITKFMVESQQKFQTIKDHLEQLKNYLPADYKKPQQCNAQQSEESCEDAIIDPKIANLTHLAQTANSSDISKNELKKIRALLKEDATERVESGLFCQTMNKNELEKMLEHLKAEQLLDQQSIDEIRQIRSKDEIVLDTLFNKKDDKKVIYFSRIFILATGDTADKKYVMGAAFVQMKVSNEIRTLEQSQPCDHDSSYCLKTSIEFPTNDALLKKYIAKKTVDFLTEQQQPGKEPWWKDALDSKDDDSSSSEEQDGQNSNGRRAKCPKKRLQSLIEAQSYGLGQALLMPDILKEQKTVHPDLLDSCSKVLPLPVPQTRTPSLSSLIVKPASDEDEDMKELKHRGLQFWTQRAFLQLYKRFMHNLTQPQIDRANNVASKFKMANYAERAKAGVVMNLAVEKIKSVVDIWKNNNMIRPDEAESVKIFMDSQTDQDSDKNFINENGKGEFIYTRVAYQKLLPEDQKPHGTMVYVLHTFKFTVPIEIKAVPTKTCYAWGMFCETKINMVPQDPKAITPDEQTALEHYMLLKVAGDYDRENGPFVQYLIDESDRYSSLVPESLTKPVKQIEKQPDAKPEDVSEKNVMDPNNFLV